MADAIAELVRAPAPAPPNEANNEQFRQEHQRTLARRLESAVATSLSLSQRCAILGSQLSVLGGIAEALTRASRVSGAFSEVLAASFDAAGVSRGALFLGAISEPLSLAASVGYADSDLAALHDFFGHRPPLDQVVTSGEALLLRPTDSDAQLRTAARVVLSAPQTASAHLVPLSHNGSIRGVLFLASTVTDLGAEGLVSFARAIGVQIVRSIALSRAFEAIAASETRYRTLMDRASCAVLTLRPDGAVITNVNRMAETLLGAPHEALVKRSLLDLARTPDRPTVETWLSADAPQGPHELVFGRPDGSNAIAEVSASHVDAGGERLIRVIANDVTERRRLQQTKALAERLATAGTWPRGWPTRSTTPPPT